MKPLQIDGKTYEPKKITLGMWRQLCEWDEKERNTDVEVIERINTYVSFVSSVYGASTDELGALPVEEIIPLYRDCAAYIFTAAFSRLDKIPNAEAGESPQN